MIKVKVNNEYKDIVKIFCGGNLQKEITKVWSREANDYVYLAETIVEYTGTLPITINANGDVLLNYRIYGSSGGCGEVTENLFDKNAPRAVNKLLNPDGSLSSTLSDYSTTMAIKVKSSTQYTINTTGSVRLKEFDDFKAPIRTDTYNDFGISSNSGGTFTTSANAAYIPYGYRLPMVTRSENLFDKEQYLNSYISGKVLDDNGAEISSQFTEYNGYSTYKMPVTAGETYTLKGTTSKIIANTRWLSRVYFFNSQNQFLMRSSTFENYTSDSVYTFTVPSGAASIELQAANQLTFDDLMLTEGSTAPTEYIPYSRTDTPVYIGDAPLEEDEYVDFGDQKIYRKNPANFFDGYFELGSINYNNGSEIPSSISIRTDFIELEQSKRFYIKWGTGNLYILPISYDENKNYVRYLGAKMLNPSYFDFGADEKYLRFYLYNTTTSPKEMMICENTNEQYYLQTDPPVPIPEIPTIDGTTIIDCDLTTKPSQMYVKYKAKR